MQRRVVITGMGINSAIGNDPDTVKESLQQGSSGIRHNSEYSEMGFRGQLVATPEPLDNELIPRKERRFMGEAAKFGWHSMRAAIADANITEAILHSPSTGIIMGSGGASTEDIVAAADLLRARGIRKVGPYRVTSTMASTVSACLATAFGIKGLNFSVASACATSAHSVGLAYQQIKWGEQSVIFAGGAEAEHWSQSCLFDAMGAFSSKRNDLPTTASRPYDIDRDGFVIGAGAGVFVMEDLEHALARGAEPIAEVTGYGTASDGKEMVSPSGEGSSRAMATAMKEHKGPVDYLNTHGTSTAVGDILEVHAAIEAFEGSLPEFSSTKSLTGHSLGACGIHELIYCALMLKHQFIAGNINVETVDPKLEQAEKLVLKSKASDLNAVMSNSFGFGGTNASIILSKYQA